MLYFLLIKYKIKRFNSSLLLGKCIEAWDHLYNQNMKTYPVWNIIVLMKWILIHGTSSSKKTPSERDLEHILKLIEKFEQKEKVISFKSNKEIKRSIRIVAYQQFWLQDKIQNYVFDCQIQLFKLLPNKNELDDMFLAKTGLSILEFLNISYIVFYT